MRTQVAQNMFAAPQEEAEQVSAEEPATEIEQAE